MPETKQVTKADVRHVLTELVLRQYDNPLYWDEDEAAKVLTERHDLALEDARALIADVVEEALDNLMNDVGDGVVHLTIS